MKKLKMMSPNGVEQNIEKIAQWMPNIITETLDEEGHLKRSIDFDLLKQELSEVIVEGEKERYQLTWPGKKEAIVNANTPSTQTLRPIKEDSVDWDTTQNVYIEGDNLEVMKLLQESYLNKVKCIYIDPPYNTGNDFVYNDDYSVDSVEYFEESGQVDMDSNRLLKNTESNGRFHSDWLTMMYSRLKIARNLLRSDGIIFISIDDNEIDNLRKICDEIFGLENYLNTIIWRKRPNPPNDSKFIGRIHEYILVYSKSNNINNFMKIDRLDLEVFRNPDNDIKGPWKSTPLVLTDTQRRPNMIYEVTSPTGKVFLKRNGWRITKDLFNKLYENGEIYWGTNGDSTPTRKRYLKDDQGIILNSILTEYGSTISARNEIKNIFGGLYFDTPKPVELIQLLVNLCCDEESIILDFFSGSATTAQSIIKLNSKNKNNHKFILIQVPETFKATSEAYKAGYTNICEIGKERIRRAAQKIKAETSADIDYGFRVYRLDSSNMKDVYYTPNELGQIEFEDLLDNIKEDRTGEDLLTQVILSCGLELSLPMETKQLDHYKIHYVNNNELIACFDENISDDVFKLIAKAQPEQVVFRDHSFKDDSTRINVTELFDTLSSNTEIRVL